MKLMIFAACALSVTIAAVPVLADDITPNYGGLPVNTVTIYEGDICLESSVKRYFYGEEHAYIGVKLSGEEGKDFNVVLRSEDLTDEYGEPLEVAAGQGSSERESFTTTLPSAGEYSVTVSGGAGCPSTFTLTVGEYSAYNYY